MNPADGEMRYRDDVRAALETAGWPDPGIVTSPNGKVRWIETNGCLASGMDHADGWSMAFDSDVPAVVIVSAALAAAGQAPVPQPETCSDEYDGEVCDRDAGHEGNHCAGSIIGWSSAPQPETTPDAESGTRAQRDFAERLTVRPHPAPCCWPASPDCAQVDTCPVPTATPSDITPDPATIAEAERLAEQAFAKFRELIAAEIQRANMAEQRIQSVTEAVILWRDRPGGDVGLAVAVAGILDTATPEPPASTAVVRALRECDRIERGRFSGDDASARDAVRRIRTALQPTADRTQNGGQS